VLIVDDDQPTQQLLEAVIRRIGFTSAIASNGQMAIDLLNERDDFRCVILDLMMPAVDGISVIAHMAKTNRRTPVIVCTAAAARTFPELDPAIVRAIIRKPFDVEELSAAVAGLVDAADG